MTIARWYGSTVTALHVYSPTPVAASYPGAVVLEPIVVTAVGREELLAQTKAFIEAEAVPGVRVEMVVRDGQAAALPYLDGSIGRSTPQVARELPPAHDPARAACWVDSSSSISTTRSLPACLAA